MVFPWFSSLFRCRDASLRCLNHRYVFDSAMNVGRLVAQVADKSQQKTQQLGAVMAIMAMGDFCATSIAYIYIEAMIAETT